MEYVHDEVTKVFENPTTFRLTFSTNGLNPCKKELVFNFGGDGLNVAFVATCRNEKYICEWQRITHIESNDVGCTLTVSGSNGYFQ